MKRTLFFTCIILLLSCSQKQDCRNQSFKSHKWSGGNWSNTQFGADDTVSFDIPGAGQYGMRTPYQFDEDCGAFTLPVYPTPSNPSRYALIYVSEDTIIIQRDGSILTAVMVKQ